LHGGSRQGMLEKYFFSSSSSNDNSNNDNNNNNNNNNSDNNNDNGNITSRVVSFSREVFLGGVKFHVGIVSGCFIVWSMADMYFGASHSVFASLLGSLLACLGVCYGMVIIHDRFIFNNNNNEIHEAQSVTEYS
jgi:hypothetical protein